MQWEAQALALKFFLEPEAAIEAMQNTTAVNNPIYCRRVWVTMPVR